jgi:hypothetical protein
MNEDVLRQRLEAAVADVHPTPRLDEVIAGRRRPGRGPQVLAVAAVVLVLGAFAVVIASRTDRTPTTVTNQPSTTSTAPTTTRPSLGDAVAVPKDLLPAGFVLVDERRETAQIGEDRWPYAVLYFAASPEDYDAGGPAIRVAYLPLSFWVEQARTVMAIGQPAPAPYGETMRLDAPLVPQGTRGALPVDDGPWVHYARSLGKAVLLLVDGRDVEDRTLKAIVEEARPSG